MLRWICEVPPQIVSERLNFPTDLYIAESVAVANGMTLRLIDVETSADIDAAIDERTGIVLLTHVDYRRGRMHDMAASRPSFTRQGR